MVRENFLRVLSSRSEDLGGAVYLVDDGDSQIYLSGDERILTQMNGCQVVDPHVIGVPTGGQPPQQHC